MAQIVPNSLSAGQIIVKNAAALLASQVSTWGLTLILMLVLPRYLGAGGVGKIYLAGSLWAIAMVFAEFGMSTYLIKEIARTPERLDSLVTTAFLLHMLLFVIGSSALGSYIYLVGYDSTTVAVIFVIGIANLIRQAMNVCEVTLRGLERMEFAAFTTVVARATTIGITLALLALGAGIVALAAVDILAALTSFLTMYYFLQRVRPIRPRVDFALVRWMLVACVPYFFVSLFLVLYGQIDAVLISLLVNADGVGWYGVTDQLTGTLLFIPTIMISVIFPSLARMHANRSEKLHLLLRKSFDYLLLIGIPVGFGLVVISPALVQLIFGESFAPSGPILAVKGIMLILTFQNILLGQYFISIDRQTFWTWVMVGVTVATIPLDLLLIPWSAHTFANGALGGAIAFVITELGMLVTALYMLPTGTLGRANLWYATKALGAGLVMVSVIWWLRDYSLPIPIITGVIIYGVAIVLLRMIAAEDYQLLLTTAINHVNRLMQRKPALEAGPEH